MAVAVLAAHKQHREVVRHVLPDPHVPAVDELKEHLVRRSQLLEDSMDRGPGDVVEHHDSSGPHLGRKSSTSRATASSSWFPSMCRRSMLASAKSGAGILQGRTNQAAVLLQTPGVDRTGDLAISAAASDAGLSRSPLCRAVNDDGRARGADPFVADGQRPDGRRA